MSIITFTNSFIPFSDPSRPLWRDIILTIIICTFLYFGPHLQRNRALQSFIDTISRLLVPKSQDLAENVVPEPEEVDGGVEAEADLDMDNTDEPPAIIDDIDGEDLELSDEGDDEWEQLPPQLQGLDEDGAGPVNPPAQRLHQPPRQRDPNRAVGAKKAKSIARRNQIRAYHEFMREQSNMQRAVEASTEKQRAKEIAAEQHRRAKVEAEIYEREQRERAARKERETQKRTEEAEAIRNALTIIAEGLRANGMVELAAVVEQVDRDVPWGESIVKQEGILGLNMKSGKRVLTLLTGRGWIVKIDEETMNEFYQQVAKTTYRTSNGANQSTIGWKELGNTLGKVLSHQHQPSIAR
jgi:hypothetical protein